MKDYYPSILDKKDIDTFLEAINKAIPIIQCSSCDRMELETCLDYNTGQCIECSINRVKWCFSSPVRNDFFEEIKDE